MLLDRDADRLANVAQRVSYDWSLVPAPVIAAIHGNCSAEVSRSRWAPTFGSPHRTRNCRLGGQVGPRSRHGHHADVPKAGTDRCCEGVDVHRPHRFRERGFRARIGHANSDDPLASALALADEIAQKSPDAVRAAKRLYDETWISDDAAAALGRESELQPN